MGRSKNTVVNVPQGLIDDLDDLAREMTARAQRADPSARPITPSYLVRSRLDLIDQLVESEAFLSRLTLRLPSAQVSRVYEVARERNVDVNLVMTAVIDHIITSHQ